MKRVLFVVPFLSGGGAERVVSVWTSELAKLNCDVHLLVFYRLEDEYPLDTKVVIHSIEKNGKIVYDSLTKWQKLKALRQALKEIRPDVVLPFVTHVGIMVSIAKIGLPLKVIETIRIDPRYSPQKCIFRWLRNISIFFSNRCIVQNITQLNYFPKFMQKKISVFSNPIANEFLEKGKEFTERRIQRVVAIGRLEKQKNYPMLISAFSKILKSNIDLYLDIYGEGSLQRELNNLINCLNLHDRVFLCGRTKEIATVLRRYDLFILSSDAEGMPNSLMEAMAVGLPCISTNCPTGPADIIEDGVNGILIPVGDEDALIKAITKMVENVNNAIEIGRKARETILNKYSAKISARKLLNFIESI